MKRVQKCVSIDKPSELNDYLNKGWIVKHMAGQSVSSSGGNYASGRTGSIFVVLEIGEPEFTDEELEHIYTDVKHRISYAPEENSVIEEELAISILRKISGKRP